jgi:hypothetical protein
MASVGLLNPLQLVALTRAFDLAPSSPTMLDYKALAA